MNIMINDVVCVAIGAMFSAIGFLIEKGIVNKREQKRLRAELVAEIKICCCAIKTKTVLSIKDSLNHVIRIMYQPEIFSMLDQLQRLILDELVKYYCVILSGEDSYNDLSEQLVMLSSQFEE